MYIAIERDDTTKITVVTDSAFAWYYKNFCNWKKGFSAFYQAAIS